MAENNSDWKSILDKLLIDANECVNLFEELQSGRTWSECLSDWVVGDRDKIDSVRLLNYMKKFIKELEKIISIYSGLSEKIKWGKKKELEYQKMLKSSNFELDYFKEGIDESVSGQFSEFSDFIFDVDYSNCKEQTCKIITTSHVVSGTLSGGTAVGIAAVLGVGLAGPALVIPIGIGIGLGTVYGAIRAIAHYKVHSRGRKRGLDYQNVKLLYDTFHEKKLLSHLQTHSVKLQQLINNADRQLEIYRLEFRTDQKDAGKDLAKATKLYYKTIETELVQLQSDEPDMNEDARKRMATKIAVSSCKSFLKASLNYSDSEAKEFIDDLQS